MSSKFPACKAVEVIRCLQALGFEKVRQKGSHIFFRHSDGRVTIVPNHRGEDIGRGLLQRILREAQISTEEFLEKI